MQDVLLSTKMIVPEYIESAIHRRLLFQQLDSGSLSKLTLVRAPAGYGKTTLLSQWNECSDEPTAWLSVDTMDNDSTRFWKYVAHTVFNNHDSDAIFRLKPAFNAQPAFPTKRLMNQLLLEMRSLPGSIRIIIDDYHLIENPEIHKMMEQFIDELPLNVSVILASRTDFPLPLEKWREQNWLTEIGVKQLRFTSKEVQEYYELQNNVFDEPKHLQAIMDVTEGWVAGLQLASLSMAPYLNGKEMHIEFDGRHPFISEYLQKEMLETYSSSTQYFLHCTSILNELTPAVCDALTGQTDSMERVRNLEKQGMLISRLDDEGSIFSYHPLLAETLRIELRSQYAEDFVAELNEKAALLFYGQGNVISAIEHALNAQLFVLAEEWILENIVEILAAGQSTIVVSWIKKLFENQYDLHPQLQVMYAFTLTTINDLVGANQIITQLDLENGKSQWMDMEEYSKAAYDFLGVKAYIIILTTGRLRNAAKIIRKRLDQTRPDNSIWDAVVTQYNQTETTDFRTNIGSKGKVLPDGKGMHSVNKLHTEALQGLTMTGYSYGVRAEKLYEWNRLEESIEEQQQAIQSSQCSRDSCLYVSMVFLESRIHASKKHYAKGHCVLDNALRIVKEQQWKDSLHEMKALLYLRQNKVGQAEIELFKTETDLNKDTLQRRQLRLLVRARILIERGQPDKALRLIIRVKTQALQEEQLTTIIESAVLEAICHFALANETAALYALNEAICRGEENGYLRTMIDEPRIVPIVKKYFKSYRQGLFKERGNPSQTYVEHVLRESGIEENILALLTPREQEVIQLVSGGSSNREIAKLLFLSEGTVRVYLSTIYGKLNVDSRTKAILKVTG